MPMVIVVALLVLDDMAGDGSCLSYGQAVVVVVVVVRCEGWVTW